MDNTHQAIFFQTAFGYASYKVIVDENGKPVDYEFLEVNPAFEILTGLKGLDIIGKSVYEVMPGIKESEYDLTAHYDVIALHGGEKEFELFFEPLNKWLRVQVSSPQKGYITTIFSDISIQFKLAEASRTFLSYTSETVDYQHIVDVACDIAGAIYAGFNICDDNGHLFTTVAISGPTDDIQWVTQLPGIQVVGQSWSYTPEIEEKFLSKKTTFLNKVSLLTETLISSELVDNLARELDVNLAVLVKIEQQGRILGGFTFIFPHQKQLQNQLLIETYTDMIGILLDRLQQERAFVKDRNSILQNNLRNLLMDIASEFINVPLEEVDASIQKALEDLAVFVDADRSYIFDYDWEKQVSNNTYEWCAEGISPEIENLQHIPLNLMGDWALRHSNGETVYIPNLFDLPEDDITRQMLGLQNIKSLLAVPMMIQGKCIGFVGFDSVRQFHHYSLADQQLLHVFAQVLTNVRIRKEMIDKLVLAKQKIEDSERKLKQSQNIAKLGAWELDMKTRIFTLNDNFYSLYHTNVSEMGGYELTVEQYAEKFLFPEEVQLVLEEVEHAIRATDPNFSRYFEHKIRFYEGSTGYIAIKYFIIKDSMGQTIKTYGVNQDITEKKLMELDLMRAKDKAEESSRLKTAFLNNISHEIRTPLNGILGFADLFMTEGLTYDDKVQYYTILQQSTNRLLQTITDIMDNAELIAKTIIPRYEEVHIASMINNQVEKLQARCQLKKIGLLVQVPERLATLVVRTDEALLGKVFQQLLDNALKFTAAGSITVGCVENGAFLRFFIHDTGKGIASDKLEAVFEPFFQEDISMTRSFEGSGLGLSIAKGILEILGGRTELASEQGKGTTVYFEIPLNQEIKS